MQLNDYQHQAMTFRRITATPTYALLNLAGEVGELTSLVAKGIRDGHNEDYRDNAKKEMGDILWQLAAVARDFGYSLEEIAQTNLNKLASRKDRGVLQGSGDNR